MTLIHAAPSRAGRASHPNRAPRAGRFGQPGSRRPHPSRPGGGPLCHRGTGVPMSAGCHRRHPVSALTTLGLALLAALITLWLGLVSHLGAVIDGGSSDSFTGLPDRLAVVRVDAGESLQDVAARVAPEAPVGRVAERIRELNALDSTTLVAGQTLIAPVG
ncbi:LysM peptidoglycan-binding domain-containing protein [Mycobacterium shinjukuense]|nr:LysM peptidoglycan-binding domain-containing protein [Mycobacterium shinjukuense]ORB70277.1 hypothetical protein BST45_06770 [Mycobacterium shinjukuense]